MEEEMEENLYGIYKGTSLYGISYDKSILENFISGKDEFRICIVSISAVTYSILYEKIDFGTGEVTFQKKKSNNCMCRSLDFYCFYGDTVYENNKVFMIYDNFEIFGGTNNCVIKKTNLDKFYENGCIEANKLLGVFHNDNGYSTLHAVSFNIDILNIILNEHTEDNFYISDVKVQGYLGKSVGSDCSKNLFKNVDGSECIKDKEMYEIFTKVTDMNDYKIKKIYCKSGNINDSILLIEKNKPENTSDNPIDLDTYYEEGCMNA